MMKKFKVLLSVLLLGLMANTASVSAANDGSSYSYDGYIYDYYFNVQETPAAFQLEKVLNSEDLGGMAIQGINDVCTSEDGRIFLTDTLSSRIFIMDSEGNFQKAIKTIWNSEGKIELDENGDQVVLNNPEGSFVYDKDQELYIADTGNKRIVVLDLETYQLKKIITKPENMTGNTEFKPSKVAVDHAKRIYAIVQSSYEGIVELASDGSFIGYYGVNVPTVNLGEYFWKSIATDEQKALMSKSYAPAFNNIAVDGEGFVMAVTYDSAAEDMVFRLNAKGQNVLREQGNTNVVGDVYSMSSTDNTQFADLAVTDYGLYALLDKHDGRIFIYDFDGVLLNVFGTNGDSVGEFKNASSIAWIGNRLVVTDSSYKCAYILSPTEFGTAMLRGSEEYYNGNWDEALKYFEKTLMLCGNYEVAYSGIGKNYLMKEEYEQAMYYFKLGNNRDYYSEAYYGYRGEQIGDHFGMIAVLVVVLIGLLIVSEVRYHVKEGKVKA